MRTSITREGAYFLFVLAFVLTGALLREINLMLILAGMMIGPLWFNWRIGRRMLREVQIARAAPDVVSAGETVVVQISLSGKRRLCAIQVEDRLTAISGDSAAPLRPTVLFPVLAAGQPGRASYRIRFERRGQYTVGPLQASTRFPLGLARTSLRVPQTRELLVTPRLGKLTPQWKRLFQEAAQTTRQSQRRQALSEGDFYGLRDWRGGDSRRHIHWRTSARRGNLMVRQFELGRHQHLALLLDLWQPPLADDDARQQVEWAVSFAATLIAEVGRGGGSRLLLATMGSKIDLLDGPASAAFVRGAFRQLALATTHTSRGPSELLAGAAARAPSHCQWILVSLREYPKEVLNSASPKANGAGSPSFRRLIHVRADTEQLFDYFDPCQAG